MTTRIGQLSQELSRTNPWWRTAGWEARDPDLLRATASSLEYESHALDDLAPGNLYLLRGPRRVGKTVTVKQTISRLIGGGVAPRSIIRVAADGWDENDIRKLPQMPGLPRVAENTIRWWFIDEISAVKGDWPAQIKWLRDNDPTFGADTVVLTGSNAAALTLAAGQLPGRRGHNVRLARTLLPIGFRTFVELTEQDVPEGPRLPLAGLRTPAAEQAFDDLLPWLDSLVRAWESYLEYGGFPAAVTAARRGDPVPLDFVNDMFDVVFRDAFSTSSLSETRTSALYSRLMTGSGSPLSLRSVAADIDIHHETVGRHVAFLRDSFLSWTCPQRENKVWLALERGQEKFYASDPILARLMHLRHEQRPDIDPTILTEMQLGMALRRRQVADGASWTGEDRLFYWRTPTRKEIDFISEDMGGTAIEGKYTEDRWRGESATLNASEWRGILATRNVLDTSGRDKAWAVPASFLAFLIDT